MKRFKHAGLVVLILLCSGIHSATYAQDSNNILGLPAVPQGAAQAGSAARAAVGGVPALEVDDKSLISGPMGLASFYQDSGVTVNVTTQKVFVGAEQRARALNAARLVQRDVSLACGKLCVPGPMPAPVVLPDNRLAFSLVLKGYVGLLSSADMVNVVTARPISPGGKQPVLTAKPAAVTPVAPPNAARIPAEVTAK